MNDDELRNLLEQLHTEIQHTQDIDKGDRDLLDHISSDIRALLERARADEPSAAEVDLARIEESIQKFEVTHPDLTSMLTRLLTILSNAGI